MANDENSLHRRLPRLMIELEDFEVNRDEATRHAYWKMKNAAWAALDAGARTAAEILDAMRAMRNAVPTSQAKEP